MKVFYHGTDGGPQSTVWGFWLFEIKRLASIVLLRFANGSREAYHSHAFHSISWLLRGRLVETCIKDGTRHPHAVRFYRPSLQPIITRRDTFHRVESQGTSWVLSFRGPWARTWREFLPRERRWVTLTDGRQEVAS